VHPTEEELELYVLDRLPHYRVAKIEEHLLLCPDCQNACIEAAEFAVAMKLALKCRPPPSVQ
jgi:hypothetical protein